MLTQCASNEIPTLEAPTTVMNVAAWAALFQIKDPVADAVPHCTLPLSRTGEVSAASDALTEPKATAPQRRNLCGVSM
jgi:hypothetical protein